MSTVITLVGAELDEATVGRFFARIGRLEGLLSRFDPRSELSQLARGELDLDAVDPSVRTVLAACDAMRSLTGGDFEHEPRRRHRQPEAPVLDLNAVAKGWIIEEAALVLRMAGGGFLVNAGGDITAAARPDGGSWRVGVQHPAVRNAIMGTFALRQGAVATSGTYERGAHIRTARPAGSTLVSVSVVGPDLAAADALATAVFASGDSPPRWWRDVDERYGLLTLSEHDRLRWMAPGVGDDVTWAFPRR